MTHEIHRGDRRSLLRRLAALCIVGGLLVCPPAVQAESSKEYKLKAEFLYNFAKFVSWPDDALGPNGEPIVFCLVGDGPIHTLLDELMEGREVKNRGIQVRAIESSEFLSDCHVLFAPTDTDELAAPLLESAKSRSVLTVGESDSFYDAGGIIRFILSGGRLRFDVNAYAASTVNLKISSQLLKLARVVQQ